MAPGQFPASPNPSMARQNAKLKTLFANRWQIVASDHHNRMTANPIRVPSLSITMPLSAWAITYAKRKVKVR